MIYCFASRRQRTGKTLLALSCGIMLSESLNGKVILVDIAPHGDVANILTGDGESLDKSLDRIISYADFKASEALILENIASYKKLDFIPASTVKVSSYFVTRSEQIAELLTKLSEFYQVVLVDTVDDVYLSTKSILGDSITAINVVDQDILAIKEYIAEIENASFDGEYVINKANVHLYPEYEHLLKLFPKPFKISEDLQLASLFNREQLKTIYRMMSQYRLDLKVRKKYKGTCLPDISNLVDHMLKKVSLSDITGLQDESTDNKKDKTDKKDNKRKLSWFRRRKSS